MDLFGVYYFFTFDGERKYKTSFGGIITIFTILFTACMMYILGQEIIFRDNPKDITVIQVNPKPLDMTFQVSTGFLIVDQTSSFIQDFDKYVRFEGNYHVLSNKNGQFSEDAGFPEKIITRKCKSHDFPAEVDYQYIIMALDYATCYDNAKTKELGGDFTGDYSKYLDMWIKPCVNTTLNGNFCKSEEEIREFLSNGQVSISLHHDAIDYNTANFSNPIKKFIKEDNYMLDLSVYKTYTYSFQKFEVLTNQGIFWTDQYGIVSYLFDNVKFDFSVNTNTKFSDIILGKPYF
jgi:hypothetical protein